MANSLDIQKLKTLLRHEVALFCQHDERKWKAGITSTVDEIRAKKWHSVFFGGTLRSLLLSRLTKNMLGRPRDVDIVVRGVSLPDLENQFSKYISRQTRFGGVQLRRVNWQFDVWPLDRTFALSDGRHNRPGFLDLPGSTFLNLEAVAVEVWPRPGHARVIYSGDDQFFHGIISRTIEINREENPFPELCVVRSLVLAAKLQWNSGNQPWKIGPKLLRYLVAHGTQMSEIDFIEVQRKHYGRIEWPGPQFRRVLDQVSMRLVAGKNDAVELPLPRQLPLWSHEDSDWPRINLSVRADRKHGVRGAF